MVKLLGYCSKGYLGVVEEEAEQVEDCCCYCCS